MKAGYSLAGTPMSSVIQSSISREPVVGDLVDGPLGTLALPDGARWP